MGVRKGRPPATNYVTIRGFQYKANHDELEWNALKFNRPIDRGAHSYGFRAKEMPVWWCLCHWSLLIAGKERKAGGLNFLPSLTSPAIC